MVVFFSLFFFFLLNNHKLVLLKQVLTAYSVYIQRPFYTYIHSVSQGEKSLSLKYETKADTVMAKLIDLTT